MSTPSTLQMAIVILAILLISFNIVGSMANNDSSYPSQSLYATHHPLIIKVIGEVHCYWCFDTNNYSLYSLHHHNNKHILKGALVEVACIVKEKILKGYGETNDKGEYKIIMEEFDECDKNETIICEAKPFAPPKDSPCNISTKLNEGTKLKGVILSNNYEIVVNAKPFAYARDKECHETYHKPSPTPYPSSSPSPSLPSPFPSSPSMRHA